MANEFTILLGELTKLPDNPSKDLVLDLVLYHLQGKRVMCSYDPNRQSKQELAASLIKRGFPKSAAVQILVQTFNISKTWSYSLVNEAIHKKYLQATGQNHAFCD